jgi:hypothetical protein
MKIFEAASFIFKMNNLIKNSVVIFLTVVVSLSIVGCSGDKYPKEISLEDAPETISAAFKDEKDENIKAMADQATNLLKSKNYKAAHGVLKRLMVLKDLDTEQRDLIAGGLMAVAENLSKAAENGDAQAGQYLKMQSFGK